MRLDRLVRAVRPSATNQFEKLAIGCLGAVRPPPEVVRPPWTERPQKPFSLLTNTSRYGEVAMVGLKVC
jgi:hypothetical protein